jgi:acyl carrier protein
MDFQERLMQCFRAVFPGLGDEEILKASTDTVAAWDSMASVSLFSLIGEEFSIEVDFEALASFHSFAEILDYATARASA